MSDAANELPLISIVVGVRNMGHTIAMCVNSLISQTYRNKEILIINDGSDDETLKVLHNIKRENSNIPIRIKTTKKMGISHARNIGFELAKGEFVAYSDADCILVDNWLDLTIPHFKDPKVALVGGITKFRSDDSYSSIYRQIEFEKRYENVKKKEVVWAGGPGSIFRKTILEEIGGFNPNWVHGEDAEISFLIYERNYKIIKENAAITYHVAEKNFRRLVFKGYRDGKAYVRATFFHPKVSLKNKFNTSWYSPYDMVFQPILYAILILLVPTIIFLGLLDVYFFYQTWGILGFKFPNVFRMSIYLFMIILLFLILYSLIPSYNVTKKAEENKAGYFFRTIILHFIRGLAWGLSLIIGLLNAIRFKFFSIAKLDDYKLLDSQYFVKLRPIEDELLEIDYTKEDLSDANLISIVIVTYNNENTIERVLESIFDSIAINYEIIIIDNNSQDKTVEIVKRIENPLLKTFFLKKNLGYARGNNYGAKMSNSEFIMFLNPDAIIGKETISKLYHAHLKLTKKFGKVIISPKIDVMLKGSQVFKLGTINSMGFAFFDHLDGYKEKNLQKTDFISGCCFLMARQDFINLDLFEPDLFMYYDDVEFSIRARINGYKLFVVNYISVLHLKTDIDYKLNKFKYYYVERNRMSTYIRYSYNPRKAILRIMIFEPVMIVHAILNRLLSTRASIYSYLIRNKLKRPHKSAEKNVVISNKTRTKDLFFFSGMSPKYNLFLIILEWILKILYQIN